MEIIVHPPRDRNGNDRSRVKMERGSSSELPVERLQGAVPMFGSSPPDKSQCFFDDDLPEFLDYDPEADRSLLARSGGEERPKAIQPMRQDSLSTESVLGGEEDGWLERQMKKIEFVNSIWIFAVMAGMFVRLRSASDRSAGDARVLAWVDGLTSSQVSLLWGFAMVEIEKIGRDIGRLKKRGINHRLELLLLGRDELESALWVLRRALEKFEYIEGHDRSTQELIDALNTTVSELDQQAIELVGDTDLFPFYGDEEWCRRLKVYASGVWWSPAYLNRKSSK